MMGWIIDRISTPVPDPDRIEDLDERLTEIENQIRFMPKE